MSPTKHQVSCHFPQEGQPAARSSHRQYQGMPECFCTRREAATTYRSYCLTQHAFHIQLTVPVELQNDEIILPPQVKYQGRPDLILHRAPKRTKRRAWVVKTRISTARGAHWVAKHPQANPGDSLWLTQVLLEPPGSQSSESDCRRDPAPARSAIAPGSQCA